MILSTLLPLLPVVVYSLALRACVMIIDGDTVRTRAVMPREYTLMVLE